MCLKQTCENGAGAIYLPLIGAVGFAVLSLGFTVARRRQRAWTCTACAVLCLLGEVVRLAVAK